MERDERREVLHIEIQKKEGACNNSDSEEEDSLKRKKYPTARGSGGDKFKVTQRKGEDKSCRGSHWQRYSL